MKLKIDIDVDLGLSPTTKKRLIRYGIPLAVILGGGALAWAGNPWALPQPSFPQNGPLTASDLNNNFNALADAGAALQVQVAALVPSGTIVAYGGTTAPPGWVFCDGTSYSGSNATYAALYSAIGTAYGGQTATSAFNVPDLRGRFVRGADDGAGNDPDAANRLASNAGGAVTGVGSLEEDAYASHYHTEDPYTLVNSGAGAGYSNIYGVTGSTSGAAQYANDNVTNGNSVVNTSKAGGSETRPVNVAANYIIKL